MTRLLLSSLLATLVACSARPTPRTVPADPFERLPNGLSLDLEADPSAPTLTVALWLPVGTADTTDFAPAAAATRLRSTLRASLPADAAADAWTALDHTAIELQSPASDLEDRIRVLLAALDASAPTAPTAPTTPAAPTAPELDPQPAPELDPQPAPDPAYTFAWQGHRFARPLTGPSPDAATLDAFARTHYRPGGAWLHIHGPLPADLSVTIRHATSSWTGAPPVSPDSETPRPGPRVHTLDNDDESVMISFTTQMLNAEEAARLDLVGAILAARSGTPVETYSPRGPGILVLRTDAAGSEKALERALAFETPSSAELARAQSQLLAQVDRARGLARLRFGGLHLYLDAVRRSTRDDVAAFARATLRPAVASAVVQGPDAEAVGARTLVQLQGGAR